MEFTPPPHHSFAACRYHFLRYMISLFADRKAKSMYLHVHRLVSKDEKYTCGCGRTAQFFVKSYADAKEVSQAALR